MPDQTQDQNAAGGGGPAALPWAQAWQEALYGRRGFYRQRSPAEHFATSAQGLPGGGEVLAAAVAALARRHGCRAVVDVGAGRGELLRHLRWLDPGLHLTGVDVVAQPAGLAVDRWLVAAGGAGLPDELADLEDSLVLAHEWLDVVPCPVVEHDATSGQWREVTATADGREHLGRVVSGPDLAWARRWLGPQVRRAEIGRPRDLAFADLLSRVRSGVVVVVDYGHTWVDRPLHGTLTGFRDGRQVEPVPDGSCDLTAHVTMDSLAQLAGRCRLSTQTALLRELVGDASDPVPHGLARSDPAAYLAAVARRAALAALTAPGGLGDFTWLLAPVRPRPHRVVG